MHKQNFTNCPIAPVLHPINPKDVDSDLDSSYSFGDSLPHVSPIDPIIDNPPPSWKLMTIHLKIDMANPHPPSDNTICKYSVNDQLNQMQWDAYSFTLKQPYNCLFSTHQHANA